MLYIVLINRGTTILVAYVGSIELKDPCCMSSRLWEDHLADMC